MLSLQSSPNFTGQFPSIAGNAFFRTDAGTVEFKTTPAILLHLLFPAAEQGTSLEPSGQSNQLHFLLSSCPPSPPAKVQGLANCLIEASLLTFTT